VGAKVLAAIVALALLPAAAQARSPKLSFLGAASGPPVTDGLRYLAATGPHGDVLYDFSARHHPAVRRLAEPGCGDLQAVGAGMVAWGCPFPEGFITESLATGATSRYSFDALRTTDIEDSYVEAIGRHWASVIFPAYHATVRRLLDLRTHALVDEPAAPTALPALDSPSAVQHACSPLRRVQPPYDAEREPFNRYFYERPYGATVGAQDRLGRTPILLQRCGRGQTVLSSCPMTCSELQLSAGVVTWYEPGRAFAYFVRSRHRLSWRVSDLRAGLGQVWLSHTRSHLIATLAPEPGGAEFEIFVARLPQS
jgi:hypothetical protein